MIPDLELVGGKPGEYLDAVVNKNILQNLNSNNIKYTKLEDNIDTFLQTSSGSYHKFSDIEDILQNTADNYPEITNLYSLGKSYEDRNVWCLEITDNPGIDENEPGVFFIGLHHAREWPTVEICLYIIEQLTYLYDSDSEIRNLVNNRRIWIVPCVNPDGYYYSYDELNDWRKNRHYFPDSDSYGVDLNRNYPGSSNGDIYGAWGTNRGSVSISPTSEVYCGPYPASELETQYIKNVFIENDICACISWHTYGELVLWPWGYSTEETTPDNSYMSQVGTEIASRITSMKGQGTYQPIQASQLYPTTGDTTDWAYGYYHYVKSKPLFAYTIEACTSFHPAGSELYGVVEENFDGALYLLEEAENIKNNVIPRVLPPEINDIGSDLDGSYEISWNVLNPDSNPNYFQLDEISDFNYIVDDAETSTDNWVLNDFVRTSEKSYSGTYSFKSTNRNSRVFSMKTKNPIPVNDDMKLSFNTWFDLRSNDFVLVEISTNGRSYDVLDKFTDCSNGWIFKEYDLNNYYDKSIFIRFRHSIESGWVSDTGFYVDDISPVFTYDYIETLSDQIQSNSYKITNKKEGIYFYRVRGSNSEHGWGDFSNLKKIYVGEYQPAKPVTPQGKTNGEVDSEYIYSTSTTDPQNDDLYYLFDWGDGTDSGWVGPYKSGERIEIVHSWDEKGVFNVRVKAKDTNDAESEWSDYLRVSMPRVKFSGLIFRDIFEKFLIFLKSINGPGRI